MDTNLQKRKILSSDDLARILPGIDNEKLIDVCTYDSSIIAQYNKSDMYEYTGHVILVRDTLARKLAVVNRELKRQGYRLKIVYGYRHPEVQARYFTRRKAELELQYPEMDDIGLDRLTHNFVAIPELAGHSTGGAVDVTLVDQDGNELDMGTSIADYADPEKIKTFHFDLMQSQKQYRQILHDAMIAEGFAPFYGEWWHFSFGDREWAAFYDKRQARFGTLGSGK